MKEFYESPLSSRYASEYMLRLFSPDKRYGTWRRLWVALARAEHRLGLPVTDEQVAQLEAHVDDEIDYAAVAEWEKKLRHDVMGAYPCLRRKLPRCRRNHPPRRNELLCYG